MPTSDVISDAMEQVLQLQQQWSISNTPPMQTRGVLIRKVLPAAIKAFLGGPQAPQVAQAQGSDGSGGKTRVPWVRVFDPDASPRATAGWYLVYLFAADGSNIALSLNQGTSRPVYGATYQAKPKSEILAATQSGRAVLHAPAGWTTDITLADVAKGPGEAYEFGNILAKVYSAGAVPTDEILIKDLHEGTSLLQQLQEAIPTAVDLAPPLPSPATRLVAHRHWMT